MKEKINTDVKKKLENIDKHISDLTFDMGDISDMYENGTLAGSIYAGKGTPYEIHIYGSKQLKSAWWR